MTDRHYVIVFAWTLDWCVHLTAFYTCCWQAAPLTQLLQGLIHNQQELEAAQHAAAAADCSSYKPTPASPRGMLISPRLQQKISAIAQSQTRGSQDLQRRRHSVSPSSGDSHSSGRSIRRYSCAHDNRIWSACSTAASGQVTRRSSSLTTLPVGEHGAATANLVLMSAHGPVPQPAPGSMVPMRPPLSHWSAAEQLVTDLPATAGAAVAAALSLTRCSTMTAHSGAGSSSRPARRTCMSALPRRSVGEPVGTLAATWSSPAAYKQLSASADYTTHRACTPQQQTPALQAAAINAAQNLLSNNMIDLMPHGPTPRGGPNKVGNSCGITSADQASHAPSDSALVQGIFCTVDADSWTASQQAAESASWSTRNNQHSSQMTGMLNTAAAAAMANSQRHYAGPLATVVHTHLYSSQDAGTPAVSTSAVKASNGGGRVDPPDAITADSVGQTGINSKPDVGTGGGEHRSIHHTQQQQQQRASSIPPGESSDQDMSLPQSQQQQQQTANGSSAEAQQHERVVPKLKLGSVQQAEQDSVTGQLTASSATTAADSRPTTPCLRQKIASSHIAPASAHPASAALRPPSAAAVQPTAWPGLMHKSASEPLDLPMRILRPAGSAHALPIRAQVQR